MTLAQRPSCIVPASQRDSGYVCWSAMLKAAEELILRYQGGFDTPQGRRPKETP